MSQEADDTTTGRQQGPAVLTDLQSSEIRYRRLFESARDGILILDAITRRITDVNPFMMELLGYTREEFLGKELWEIGLLSDAPTSAGVFRELQANGYIRYEDLPLQTKDGQPRAVEFVSNVYNENGRQVIQCNIRDITGRKLAQDTTFRIAAIVESSDDAIITKTLDGVISTWNLGAQKMYGYTPQEAIGRSVSFLAPPTLPDEMPQLLAKIRRGELVEHYETVRVRKDGSSLDISLSISPLKDAKGTIIGASSIKRDITGRKQAEAALMKSELRYHSLFENMLEGYACCRTVFEQDQLRDFVYEEVNSAFEKQTGLKDVVGKKVSEVIPGLLDVNEELFEMYGKVALTGKPEKCETYIAALDIWLCVTAYSHAKEHFVAVFEDITERKEAEAALLGMRDELELRVEKRTSELERANVALQAKEGEQQQIMATLTQSEERFRLLVESVHDYAILMLDTTGRIMTWNAGAERMKGYRAEEIIGQHFSCFYTAEDQKAGKPQQELEIAEADGYLDHECWRVRSDGSRFWATLVITALRDDSGRLRGFAKITRDITERKNVEAALHEAKDQADAANLAKSEFLSRMSHELRTPLNAILGFGQILERQDLTVRSKESVGYILKGGRHLLNLINEVLDIARVEAGRLEISLEPVALNGVVPEVCALVRTLASDRHIILNDKTCEISHNYVMADLQRLKQVLINLLSNAIKYNDEGGQVEVSCALKHDGVISIEVSDTGPGISQQDLPKLFTPFVRLGATTSTVEGTGLGLALSQRLVMAMNGTLSVQSTLGQGTTFTVELPQASATEVQLANVPDDILHPSTGDKEATYSVLCIEDNPSNLRLMETIFEGRPEITLLAAMQGSVGLDLANLHKPDLILLDLDLPDIHGKDVLTRLQQSTLTRDIPVIIVSADATARQVDRLLTAGAKAYLTKPLNVRQLLDTVDSFLFLSPGVEPTA